MKLYRFAAAVSAACLLLTGCGGKTGSAASESSSTVQAPAFGAQTPEEAVARMAEAYNRRDAAALFDCMPECFAVYAGDTLLQKGIADLQAGFDSPEAEFGLSDELRYRTLEVLTLDEAEHLNQPNFAYLFYDDAEDAAESVSEMLESWGRQGAEPEYRVVHILMRISDGTDRDDELNMGIVVYQLDGGWFDTFSAEIVEEWMQSYIEYGDETE